MDSYLVTKMTSLMNCLPKAPLKEKSTVDDGYWNPEDYERPNLLLSLIHPDVTSILLEFLDIKSLLALRLVCKQTKSWVEEPKCLSRLRITLHSSAGSKKMRKVLRSKTNFCNFRFGCEKKNNEELLQEFGLRFGSTLRIIDINTIANHNIFVGILNYCICLERLYLLGINLQRVGDAEIEALSRISGVFKNLKFLSVGNILFVEEKEMKYFQTILEKSTSLQTLRLPYINFQSKRPKHVRDEIIATYVVKPLIYLINSQAPLRYLILEYLNPLSPKLFLHVATACFQNKTILHNVHESHLKRLPSTVMSKSIQEIIGTLDGVNNNVFLSKLVNLKCISVWVSSALQMTADNFVNASLPLLVNMNLYIDTLVDNKSIDGLVSTLLGYPRPTVSSLKISYNSRNGSLSAELCKAVDISKNFQNLRKLDIYQWDAYDDEFLTLWKGLGAHRIQDLSLLLCANLSDHGILGEDSKKPAILNLTGLQDLQISSLYGSITNTTLQRALRHMALTKLRLYSQSITYDGIASLLDGVFCTTVEYVHFSKPMDCTQKEYYYLVKDILDAKNQSELTRKRHIRRRSQPLLHLQYEPTYNSDEF